MDGQNWFGVRTVYEHVDRARGRERLYEEPKKYIDRFFDTGCERARSL
jgi:hypothetical protein